MTRNFSPFSLIARILGNPMVSILAMAAGVATGILFTDFASRLKPVGDVFLLLLKMCVIPILVTSIISSFARLVGSKEKNIKIHVVFFSFLAVFIVLAVFTYAVVTPLKPGILSAEEQKVLGGALEYSQENYIEDINSSYNSFSGIMNAVIPENIFKSLAGGDSLQILFFSILIGIAAGLIERKKGDAIIDLADSFFHIFLDIINWIMLILPFGLFALLARQVADTGIDILFAMAKYVLSIYLISFLVILVNAGIISWKTGVPFFKTFYQLKSPLLISFGTRSTFASMPVSINALTTMKINSKVVNLVIPLGSILARFSMLIIYVSAAVFARQLYDVDFTMLQVVQLISLAIIVSIAGAGTPAIVSLSMLSILFSPLAVPYSSIVVLLLAIIPVIDPILTMANVHTNCLLAILIAGPKKRRRRK